MNDLNFVSVIGRLTKDPELKYTQSGTAILGLSIAVNRSQKQGNEWKDVASFFDVSVWGKQAENLNQYLHKGKQIGVAGHLEQQRWQSQDGSNRSRVVIMAENIQLLGGNESNQNNQGYNQNQGYQPRQNFQQPQNDGYYPGGNSEEFPNEIPF